MKWSMEELKELIKCINKNDLTEIQYTEGDKTIVIKKERAQILTSADMPSNVNKQNISDNEDSNPSVNRKRTKDLRAITDAKVIQDRIEFDRLNKGKIQSDVNKNKQEILIKSPQAGIFYRQSEPGADPYVEIGTKVKKGDTIGLIEAMKMITEIKASYDGIVMEIMAENEAYIEYDKPLMIIKTD